MLAMDSLGSEGESGNNWGWLEGIEDKKEEYFWGTKLGAGSFGDVRLVKKKKTGDEFAAKLMSRQQMEREGPEQVEMECKVLTKLKGAPYTIKMDQFWSDRAHVFIVTEIARGGELLGEIKARCAANKSKGIADVALSVETARFYLAGTTYI